MTEEQDTVLRTAINEEKANQIIQEEEEKGRRLEDFQTMQEGILTITLIFRKPPKKEFRPDNE